ncbi:hypothetical protein SMA75_26130, partial [Escherichia coli]|uniref:hypothetical protein n=1 Tax=Escherichia coli TaxID=562 RepID=UPI00309D4EB3
REDARALQEDLNKLSPWSEKWQMMFDITKCSALSVGTRNPLHGYSLDSPAYIGGGPLGHGPPLWFSFFFFILLKFGDFFFIDIDY